MSTTNIERKVWFIEDAEYARDAELPPAVEDAWVTLMTSDTLSQLSHLRAPALPLTRMSATSVTTSLRMGLPYTWHWSG